MFSELPWLVSRSFHICPHEGDCQSKQQCPVPIFAMYLSLLGISVEVTFIIHTNWVIYTETDFAAGANKAASMPLRTGAPICESSLATSTILIQLVFVLKIEVFS